jgi:hypothetical protein
MNEKFDDIKREYLYVNTIADKNCNLTHDAINRMGLLET